MTISIPTDPPWVVEIDGVKFATPSAVVELLKVVSEERDSLEQRVERYRDALEHCGYDPTDCIDCGGPPHNEWCRFWKLRNVVPILFAAADEASEQ